ncbi:GTP-binding protein [Paraglaciecola aquimarina]|uniref:GTP-binding protein n=1 Tax=Paraglaciecola algarum TaxID=3050085 RepID=A0ABS9D6P9_9ALTE|nr:GTP-binding protein [Paraglaciecola sp. G1-23]MCF2947499.1 GTP-binding protein [Paraglaciecola sp. G1-23]
MLETTPKIEQVPTNIITGALGVGKTTLIQALLEQKPKHERWAVLVNEFGEIGVDGALLTTPEEDGIFIKEVPGGCMCCTSGLPMQIALNLLLARAKPHRLLIEPTGLGHPREVLQTLSEEHYKEVLDIRATLALIDIRKLADKRWRAHQPFQEQLEIADHIVVTKSDLYQQDLTPQLNEYLQDIGISNLPIRYAQQGKIDPQILLSKSKYQEPSDQTMHSHSHSAPHDHESSHPKTSDSIQTIKAPETGSIKVENNADGYYSYGWICAPTQIFDFRSVMDTLSPLTVERLKGILITEQGVLTCNLIDGCLSVSMTGLEQAADSRLEFITDDKNLAEQTSQRIEHLLNLAPN